MFSKAICILNTFIILFDKNRSLKRIKSSSLSIGKLHVFIFSTFAFRAKSMLCYSRILYNLQSGCIEIVVHKYILYSAVENHYKSITDHGKQTLRKFNIVRDSNHSSIR